MGIITRYVLFEIMRIFLVALVGLSMVVIVAFGLKEAMSNGLPPIIAIQAMFYMVPETLGVTIPISCLLAVTSVYGRMASTNEIVALKASGVNPLTIVWPVLVFSAVLSLFTVVTYDVAAGWGRPSVKYVAAAAVDQIAYSILRSRGCYRCPQFTILVQRVEDDRLINPTIIIDNAADPKQKITVGARLAYLTVNQTTNCITIRLFDGQIDQGGKIRYAFSNDWWVYDIPLPSRERPVHRDWLLSSEIPKEIAKMEVIEKSLEKELEYSESMPPDDVARRKADLKEVIYQMNRLKTETYRRWANGFTCFFFALVGIPVAMYVRFESFLSGFFACFLPILCLYYPVLMFQEKLTITGVLPPIFFWTGNMLMVGPGFGLLHQVRRF
jgi:lipopolysaccharide export system permease protein